jgi:hypothetical protein
MRWTIAFLMLTVSGVALLGCRDDSGGGDGSEGGGTGRIEGDVHGFIRCSHCQDEFNVSGSLGEDGAKYYGYWTLDGEDLSLVVATDTLEEATASSDFYFELTGIEGPPTTGYKDPVLLVTKDDPSLHTGFDECTMVNVNHFVFGSAQAADPDLCVVKLFAEPAEGELNPNLEQFDYFVWFKCQTISVPSSADSTIQLTSVEAELFLSGE